MEHRVLPSLNAGTAGMGVDKYGLMLAVLIFLVVWKCTFCNFKESAALGVLTYAIRIVVKYYKQEVIGFVKSELDFKNYYDAWK